MPKYEVTFNLGYVTYEVEAQNKDEAVEKAQKIRVEDDGYISPTSELDEVKEIEE